MPHEVVAAPDHDRNRSLGWLATDWIEHFCVHGPGDVEGDKVTLDDEFAGFVVDVYAHDAAARRCYDSAFLSRSKGRAKSELAGFITLFEAMGPCRTVGFAKGGEKYRFRDFEHTYVPGEPIGAPIRYPFIRCLATEEGQAGMTYDNVYFNLTQGPLAEGLPRETAGMTRTLLPGGGEIRPSTAANASKDGGKESFVVFDETHRYTLAELRRMYGTVRRNLAKRKLAAGWSLETSTMYLPGEGSVAEETHDLAKMIRAKRVKRARLFFDHREAPECDLADEAELRAALRYVYGPFADVMDLQRILDEIWDPRSDPQDSRRYFLNQPTSAQDAWITTPEWAAKVDATKIVADKDVITMGFDGSRKRTRGVTDATVLIGCRVSDGHTFEIGIWEQPDGPAGEGWQVPAAKVDAAVDAAFKRYTIVAFFADPAKWETYVARWEAKYGARLKVKASRDHPIEWWMTGGRSIHIVQALDEFHTAVVDSPSGEFSHSGEDALSRHVLNARRRPSRSGMQIGKEHPDSPKKIDAAIGATLAYRARTAAIAKGVGKKGKSRKVRRY